ncbi:MAG: AI-2E family transporter [Bryobacteraceae bacterium]
MALAHGLDLRVHLLRQGALVRDRGSPHLEKVIRDENTIRVLRWVVLAALTAIASYLCWKLTAPFLNAFTWALALAIACGPLRTRLFARMPALPATLLIMAVVIVVIATPVAILSRELFHGSLRAQSLIQTSVQSGEWRGAIEAHPWLGPMWLWADQQLDLSQIGQRVATAIARSTAPAVARSIGFISNTGVALLALFFFLRDQETVLAWIRRMLPLEESETDLLLTRVSSAIQSAVYGRLFIGSLQGLLGGIVFALVGLPAPVFWGAVMGLLSTLPFFGAFLVWVPAGVYLMLGGHWIRAVIVLVWGFVVIHPVDNLLYPAMVGSRLGLHPLVLFIAFVGGMIAFGPSGLILGPCIIAATAGIAEVWQRRGAPQSPDHA